MKAYAITNQTMETGVIETIEGVPAEHNEDVFIVKSPGEINRYYYAYSMRSSVPGDGFWFHSDIVAKAAAEKMRRNSIKDLNKTIDGLKKLKFTIK